MADFDRLDAAITAAVRAWGHSTVIGKVVREAIEGEGWKLVPPVVYPFKSIIEIEWVGWCPCGWSEHQYKSKQEAQAAMDTHQEHVHAS